MSQYGTVDEQVIQEIGAIVGLHNITRSSGDLEEYAFDEAPDLEKHLPALVVRPEDTQSVSRLMKYAHQKKIPVTPRGAGTGLSGGAVPLFGGIVLSLERMDKIVSINSENFTATVEPGVRLSDLTEKMEEAGLYYPLHPGEMSATIGGSIATNAGGMNAVKYGVTRNNVLGLEVVLPNGDVIHTGGEFVKCSTGYDLTQLIIGSEGTLGIVTGIILKLTTKPAFREVLFAPFNDLQDAIDTVPEILALRHTPIGIEFMEQDILQIVEKFTGEQLPYRENAYLMIIMEGDSEESVLDYFGGIEEICMKHGSTEAVVAGSEAARRSVLEIREKFFHAIKRTAAVQLVDTVVPRSQVARFVKQAKQISAEYGIPIVSYGHAGDGNVHLHPLCQGITEAEWREKLPGMMKALFEAAVSFGGAISGEHGIGLEKKKYMPIQIDEPLLNVMKAVKRAFDPENILNPGKIFDL